MKANSDLNSDKFDFSKHARDLARTEHEQFAPLDTPPGIGLRQFLDHETRRQAASGGSSETLIPGRLYLRLQPCGLWELCLNRGRGTFDCWVGSREEMLQLAEELQNQGWRLTSGNHKYFRDGIIRPKDGEDSKRRAARIF